MKSYRGLVVVVLVSSVALVAGCKKGGEAPKVPACEGGGARSSEAATVKVFATDVVAKVNRKVLGTAITLLHREIWQEPENLEDPTLVGFFEDLDPELFVIDNTMLGYPFYPESTGPMDKRLSYLQLLERVGVGPFDCSKKCGADIACQGYCGAVDDPYMQKPPHKGYDELLAFTEQFSPAPKICLRIPTIFTTLLEANVYDGLDLQQLKIPIDPKTAVDLLEYLNGDATTTLGKLRATNGHPAPYDVHCFMLGNELWVNYTWAQMPMSLIVDQTLAFASAMKAADPTVELGFNLFALTDYPGAPWDQWVSPGSQAQYATLKTFNDELLTGAGSALDFVTLHAYGYGAGAGLENVPEPATFDGNTWQYALGVPAILERHDVIGGTRAFVDRYNPGLKIVVDEFDGASGSQGGALYNAEFRLYLERSGIAYATNWGSGLFAPHTRFGLVKTWEDPTQTPVRRPTYYALQMLIRGLKEDRLRAEVLAPPFDTVSITDDMMTWPAETGIPGLSVTATRTAGDLSVTLINRLLDTDLEVRVNLQGATASGEAAITTLGAPGPACNNEEVPDTVVPLSSSAATDASGVTVTVPAHGIVLVETTLN